MGRQSFYSYTCVSHRVIPNAELLARLLADSFANSVYAHRGMGPELASTRRLSDDEAERAGLVPHAGASWYRLDGTAVERG